MSDPNGLSGPELRAALIMTRWAAEAGYRRLRWSAPNDASWPAPELMGVPVRHDGMPGQFDLLGHRRWRRVCVVCSLRRGPDGYQVSGVPGEEWLRPSTDAAFAATTQVDSGLATAPQVDSAFVAIARADPEPSPPRRRPRVRLAAAALGLAVPATTLGGVALLSGEGQDPPPPPTAAPSQAQPPALPPLPTETTGWVSQARVRLAATERQLAALERAEAAWAAIPADRRPAVAPPPVRELQAAWAELVAQRTSLQQALAAWEDLNEARSELVATEHQLAEVRSAAELAQTRAARQLRAEADRLQRRASQVRERMNQREAEMSAVAATPLPEPVEVEQVAETVVALAAPIHGTTPADSPGGSEQGRQQEGPVVAGGREIEPGAADVEVEDDADPDDEPGPEPGDTEEEPELGGHTPEQRRPAGPVESVVELLPAPGIAHAGVESDQPGDAEAPEDNRDNQDIRDARDALAPEDSRDTQGTHDTEGTQPTRDTGAAQGTVDEVAEVAEVADEPTVSAAEGALGELARQAATGPGTSTSVELPEITEADRAAAEAELAEWGRELRAGIDRATADVDLENMQLPVHGELTELDEITLEQLIDPPGSSSPPPR